MVREEEERWKRGGAADLEAVWLASVPDAPRELACQALAEVSRCYAAPDRHYHNLDHVAAVVGEVVRAGGGVNVVRAAFLHDLIYDPRRSDNEERSAQESQLLLASLGVPASDLAEVVRLILLTRSHCTEAEDVAGALLLDADLAILGAEPDAYAQYAAAIRREYAWVPATAYRAGRRQVLERFLERPRLYVLDVNHGRWEASARRNLANELASLAE
ncbi:MAG: hypothetical protein U0840_03360 [Gemmataceae bacterium]